MPPQPIRPTLTGVHAIKRNSSDHNPNKGPRAQRCTASGVHGESTLPDVGHPPAMQDLSVEEHRLMDVNDEPGKEAPRPRFPSAAAARHQHRGEHAKH